MNDPLERLEAELKSMKPHPVSDRLRDEVARGLPGTGEFPSPLEGEGQGRGVAGLSAGERFGGYGTGGQAAGGTRNVLPAPPPRPFRFLLWAGFAAAAAIVVGVFLSRGGLDGDGDPKDGVVKTDKDRRIDKPKGPDGGGKPDLPDGPRPSPRADPGAPPTVLAYRSVIDSPEALDALLSRHAGRMLPAGDGPSPRARSGFAAEL